MQSLLHTRRTVRPHPVVGDLFPRDACFALTTEEARAVSEGHGPNPPGFIEFVPPSPDEGAIGLFVVPLMPHGAMFMWGG